MLKFKNPQKELPEDEQVVLIKYTVDTGYYEKEGYYVCTFVKKGNCFLYDDDVFIEECGSGDTTFSLDEILGWIPIEELNEIQIEED